MIGVTRVEAVTTIELQRAERRNALNSELVEELREAVEKATAENVRAIVLTGQGSVFCAGADLSGDAFAADYPDRLIALHKALDAAPMPVIGAINGPAIGAGLQLAMQCDLRVVAPDAFFQFPTSKYGLALDNWSIRRLCSLVGHGRARAMLLAAEKLGAEEALATGMANRIGTVADAQAWAAEIAGLAPLALQHAKRVLNDDGAIEDPAPIHKELFDKAWASQDAIEAQVARMQKRPPKFRGPDRHAARTTAAGGGHRHAGGRRVGAAGTARRPGRARRRAFRNPQGGRAFAALSRRRVCQH
ncbi:putative enoyl-CoA hydratase echA6 domain protein [Mycobacterium xenopi 3993]|nr:putative enoyl-CoA hydratase echA6 domain protein [Mycobacterium xenopi 3993]